MAELGVFLAGLALPYVLTCVVLLLAGVFPQFWFWTTSYASRYVGIVGAAEGTDKLKRALAAVVGPNLGFWLLPWAGAWMMWWDERLRPSKSKVRSPKSTVHSPQSTAQGDSKVQPPETTIKNQKSKIKNPRLFLTLLLFCSFGSVSIGFYFREHYFITLLPVLALLTGVAVSRSVYLIEHNRSIELVLSLPVFLGFVIALGAALLGNIAFWFTLSPTDVVRYTYSTSIFSEARKAADYIKANTVKGARIAVLGSEPEIYFYSGRRSATGFIYMYPLMEEQPFAMKMQQQMISEIERNRPEYVVYVDDDKSWLPQANSKHELKDWWKGQVGNFDLVEAFDIKEEKPAETTKARREATEEPPEVTKHLLVFKRKGS